MATRNLTQDIRFATYGRSWMIPLRGRRGPAVDRWFVRRTGFSPMSLQCALAGGKRYVPALPLTTIGAKSGELRTVTLPYLEWQGSYVTIGSNAGGPIDPHWVGNLRGDVHCWLHVTRHKPNVARHQERASTYGREVPLVVLLAPRR